MNSAAERINAPGGRPPARGLWRSVARAWAAHVVHPVPRADAPFAASRWRVLLALLSMATPLALLSAIALAPFTDDLGLRSRLDFRFSALEALLVLLVAPCIEELVFRGPLGSRRLFERAVALLPFALVAGAALWPLLRALPAPGLRLAGIALLAAVLAVVAIALDETVERRRFTHVDAQRTFFARHFRWIAHGSTIAFALSHGANYALEWDTVWFVPLAVLPQLVLGYACLYARAALGLHGAILLHAGHNVIAYSLAALAQ